MARVPMQRRPNLGPLLGLAVASLIGAVPMAAQESRHVLRMTTRQAADAAGAVVVAKVLGVRVSEESGGIWTFVDLQTLDVVKGTVAPQFTYRMFGGRVGDVQIRAGDEPRFSAGEEYVLFLGPERSPEGYPTLFRGRHLYSVRTAADGTKFVSPPPEGLAMFSARTGAAQALPFQVRLEDFVFSLKQVR